VTVEIVKADALYRKKLFTVYLVMLLLGVVIWKWGVPALLHQLSTLPNREHIEVREIISHSVLVLFIPAAIYLISIGRKVCKYRAMPYPGMRVIRDTVVVTNEKALFRGRSMIVLGTAMIIIVVISMISTHFITLRFKHHPLIRSVFYGSAV